jgi:putative membrane protein
VANPPEETAPRLPDQSQLALERTRLAYERTLLAWVRTAFALISFGFTVYKFFQYLHESEPARYRAHLFGPREFALVMIGIGLVALLLATLEHRSNVKALRAQFGPVRLSLAALFAGLVACLGLIGFLAVVFHQ